MNRVPLTSYDIMVAEMGCAMSLKMYYRKQQDKNHHGGKNNAEISPYGYSYGATSD